MTAAALGPAGEPRGVEPAVELDQFSPLASGGRENGGGGGSRGGSAGPGGWVDGLVGWWGGGRAPAPPPALPACTPLTIKHSQPYPRTRTQPTRAQPRPRCARTLAAAQTCAARRGRCPRGSTRWPTWWCEGKGGGGGAPGVRIARTIGQPPTPARPPCLPASGGCRPRPCCPHRRRPNTHRAVQRRGCCSSGGGGGGGRGVPRTRAVTASRSRPPSSPRSRRRAACCSASPSRSMSTCTAERHFASRCKPTCPPASRFLSHALAACPPLPPRFRFPLVRLARALLATPLITHKHMAETNAFEVLAREEAAPDTEAPAALSAEEVAGVKMERATGEGARVRAWAGVRGDGDCTWRTGTAPTRAFPAGRPRAWGRAGGRLAHPRARRRRRG